MSESDELTLLASDRDEWLPARDGDTGLVSRRSVSTSIASFGGAQFAIAASSVVRLPLLASVLGQGRFGLNFVVGNLAPFLLAIAGGVRIASRALVAQQRGAKANSTIAPTMARMNLVALRAAFGLAAAGIALTYILPLHHWLGAGSLVSEGEFNASIAVTIALCAGACLGAVGWGKLEAEGRVPLLNGFIAGTAVFGLVLTAALTFVTKSFFVYAIVNSGTSALPWYLPLGYVVFRLHHEHRGVVPAHVARRAAALGSAQAAAPLASRALDPFVISARVSPQAAAPYGVAQRMSVVTTIVPAGVGPLIAAHYAQRRGSRHHATFRELLATAGIYALVGGMCGVVLVILGPSVAHFLDHGETGANRALFVAFLVLGITSSAQYAFSLGATGPRSMYASLWIDGSCALGNAVLSFVLVGPLGVRGPVVASIIGSSVAVVVWIAVLARRRDLLSDVHEIAGVDGHGSSP
ncbi:MAG TPA: hypothetical protein VGO03_11145 [Acidimicrobiia bacterium]|jgi:Na+-driven multidrug efflux pump